MKINFTKQDPLCYNANNGYININTIDLSLAERHKYGIDYTIEWSENVSIEQIKSKFFINNLKADTYKFRLCNNTICSDWHQIELNNPNQIKIISIDQDNDLCKQVASVSIKTEGAKPPLIAHFGTNLAFSDNDTIHITGIYHSVSDHITITDSQNCSIKSENIININFSQLFHEIKSIKPPIIHDDHPQELIICIKNSPGSHKFIIYESVDNIKQQIVAETQFDDNHSILQNDNNSIKNYNLSNIVYPGSYIIDIIDQNNCVYTTDTIHIPNLHPLKVNIKYHNNNIIPNINIVETEFIFDTILIPYHRMINDLNLLEWIKNLRLSSIINLTIGKQKYQQKIIKYDKDYTKYQNNIFDILQLGSSSEDWYFSINIGKGFNRSNDVFSDNIYIEINDQQYLVIPSLDSDINSFKLIRGNLLTNSFSTNQFKNSNILQIYHSDDINDKISDITYNQSYSFYNTYKPGLIFTINLIDNNYSTTQIDLNSPENYIFDFKNIKQIDNLKYTLQQINQYTNNINISAINNTEFNGQLSVYPIGGVPLDKDTYNIQYYQYNTDTQELLNIYYNNQIVKSNNLFQLPPGTYIIKISDSTGNKLKYINNEPYDNHYGAALSFIENQLGITTQKINFNYGDVIVNIMDDNTAQIMSDINQNIPGLSIQDSITTLKSLSVIGNDILIINGDHSHLDNEIIIIINNEVDCTIIGPNNFKHIFNRNIKLVHLSPGVYTITGDDQQLEYKHLSNTTNKIYIGDNTKEYIHLHFPSYHNQFIVKN
jgi:hypothetical protein